MTARSIVILIALAVGLIDLIVMRRRGGLHLFVEMDLQKVTRSAWISGGQNLISGIILTPNIALAIVRSHRRMRPVRLKHRRTKAAKKP
jgi:hypothetical protein